MLGLIGVYAFLRRVALRIMKVMHAIIRMMPKMKDINANTYTTREIRAEN